MFRQRLIVVFFLLGLSVLTACSVVAASLPVLQIGNRGEAVMTVQGELAAAGYGAGPTDGIFGQGTQRAVEAFQGAHGLTADGVVGPVTWAALGGFAGEGAVLQDGAQGPTVAAMQKRLFQLGFLGGPVDGVLGPATMKALEGFQRWAGLVPDGIFGPATGAALAAQAARRAYVVESGDSLAAIAARFGVSQVGISQANGLTNPNLLWPGQHLTIPVSVVTDTVTQAPPPTPVSEPSAPPRVFGGVVLGKLIPPGDIGTSMPATSVPKPVKARPKVRWKLALTFDDGPDPTLTPKILTLLKQYRAVATFFVSGPDAARFSPIVRELAAAGNRVEVLPYDGEMLCRLSSGQVAAQLGRTAKLIRNLTGQTPDFFRPPGGCFNAATVKAAKSVGLSLLLWNNVGGQDMVLNDPGILARQVLRFAHQGMVLMLHDTKPVVAKALPLILKDLVDGGYGLVTLNQLPR